MQNIISQHNGSCYADTSLTKYYIAFDTQEMAPNIRAVTVELKHEVVTDDHAPMSVNLCEHPLYPQLCKYVKSNPHRVKKEITK